MLANYMNSMFYFIRLVSVELCFIAILIYINSVIGLFKDEFYRTVLEIVRFAIVVVTVILMFISMF